MEEAEYLCDRVGFYEVSIADVFHAVKVARARLPVYAWGLSPDTTLEDVFIKVTSSAEQSHTP